MTGGALVHRERYPIIDNAAAADYFLTEWVDEYDTDMWGSSQIENGLANTNKTGGTGNVDVVVFEYAPHGITSSDKEDRYHIYYAAVTTTQGDANGYDYDGYVMWASQDADLDGNGDVTITITNDANTIASTTANGDTPKTDLTFFMSP